MQIPGEELSEMQVRILEYLYKRSSAGFVRDNDIYKDLGEDKVPFQSEIEKSLSYLVEKEYIACYRQWYYKILAKGIDYLKGRGLL